LLIRNKTGVTILNEITRHGITRRWSDVVIHQGTAYFVEVPDDASQDPRGQFSQVFSQIDSRLHQIGSDKTRLLQVVIYLPHPTDLPLFNELWDAWIPEGHTPSRACIHAVLASPAYRVEMILTAAVSSQPTN
jgi:enamine deaminase RidA (YjgF/YER057c/UK114 family)